VSRWILRLGHLGFLALILWGFVARFGYTYGWGDQDEVLPVVLHRLDPDLLGADWFVTLYSEAFGVREVFIRILTWLGGWLSLPVAVALLYGLVFLALAHLLWRWTATLFGSSEVAYGTTALTLWGTLTFTLGGNRLAYSMLVPEMPAVALALLGLLAYVRGRWLLAAIPLGLACWLHPLVGLQVGGLLGLLTLLTSSHPPLHRLLYALAFGAVALAVAAPVLWPLWLTQQAWRAPVSAESLFYILVQFRNPHHYLAFAFPALQWGKFTLLVLFALLARSLQPRPPGDTFMRNFLLLSALLWIFSLVSVDLLGWLPVARMQWFKLSLFAPPLLTGYGVFWLWNTLPEAFARLLRWRGWAIGAFLLGTGLWIWTGIRHADPFWQRRLAWQGPHDPHFADLARWARTQTEAEAVFAVPPFESRWRTAARRATVVTFQAFPYLDRAMVDWYERIQALTRIGEPPIGGYRLEPMLTRSYHALQEAEWLELAQRYGIRYIVRQRHREMSLLRFPVAYENPDWVAYRIPSPSPLEGRSGWLGYRKTTPAPP
jgi:hypothetical protein